MRLGDVIEWAGHRWIVRRMDRQTRTAVLHDGTVTETIPDDLDVLKPEECKVIANPPDDWPFIAVPQRPKFGRLVKVSHPQLNGTSVELVRWRDWMVADPLQPGGVIFFDAALGLRIGDMLLAEYERGKARIQVPREFLSSAQRKARDAAAAEEPPRLTVYDRLRRNEFADDD